MATPNTIEINLPSGLRTVGLYLGTMLRLIEQVKGAENIPEYASNPIQQGFLVAILLANQDEILEIRDAVDVNNFLNKIGLSPEEGNKLITWALGHITNFSLQRLQAAKEVLLTYQEAAQSTSTQINSND